MQIVLKQASTMAFDLEKAVESIAVKPVDTPTETPQTPQSNGEQTQTQTQTETTAQTEAPKAQEVDRWKVVNEVLGTEFKGEEDFSAWHSAVKEKDTKLSEYEQMKAQWEAEREELSKAVDPQSYFASPELFTLNGLLKKFPDKNPIALTEISTRDFSKAFMETPIDVLALDLMLEHPGIYSNKAEAIEDLHAKYNVSDPDDIDAATLRRMKVDAKTAVDKFTTLKGQIEQPKPVSLPAERQAKIEAEQKRITEMTEATKPLFTKAIPESLKAIEIPITVKDEKGNEVVEVAFKYDIGDNYAKSKAVQDVIESVRQATIKDATPWTAEREARLKSDVTDLLLGSYLKKHISEIYVAMRDDLMSKFTDESWMQRHNPRPVRQDAPAPQTDPKKAKVEQNLREVSKELGFKTQI